MLEAPNLSAVKEHMRQNTNAICCILFAPKFSQLGFEDIIHRFGYLDYRTGEDIHFYCAGYGGYWHPSDVPDMADIGIGKYQGGTEIPWAFSQKLFAEFVDEMEKETSWKYSGGSEIIVINPKEGFSNCIIFKLDTMIKDEIIDYPGQLFEALIQHARRKRQEVDKFSLKGIGKIG